MGLMQDDTESDVVSVVSARVRNRFPQVATRVIDEEVAGVFRQFADSRIRVYLPILVEREAVARIREQGLAVLA